MPITLKLPVGQQARLSANGHTSGAVAMTEMPTWQTTNAMVASIAGPGPSFDMLVAGVGVGSATVTATIDGQSDTATVEVVANVPDKVVAVSMRIAKAAHDP